MEEDTTSIALLPSAPTGSWCAADKHGPVTLTPESLDAGVDVGAIACALCLDPSTVRLNGHLLGVSLGAEGGWVSSVTWRSLLTFFSSRGHPTGAADDPIRVQGKVQSPGSESGKQCTVDHPSINTKKQLSLKRKVITQDSCQAKKRRTGSLEDGDEGENGQSRLMSSILCLKWKLRLEGENGQKRAKTAGNFLTTVLHQKVVGGLFAADTEPPGLRSNTCVAEHFKHSHQKACSSS